MCLKTLEWTTWNQRYGLVLVFPQSGFSRPPALHQRRSPERVASSALRAVPHQGGGGRGAVPPSQAFGLPVDVAQAQVSGAVIDRKTLCCRTDGIVCDESGAVTCRRGQERLADPTLAGLRSTTRPRERAILRAVGCISSCGVLFVGCGSNCTTLLYGLPIVTSLPVLRSMNIGDCAYSQICTCTTRRISAQL